jgi:CheY-like chemotaxis protein/anti-sigma regulatory factor (Ser/Thr protein kinase)
MIEMSPDLDRDLPKIAGIDSELREAMTNLIINAIDAMPEGGQLMIRTRSAKSEKSGAKGSSSHAIVEVSDTGVGMDDETRRRCLEPFFSTKGKRGTGLGLAMVYGVVERHEGKIEIDSAIGRGTTMRLVFPVRAMKTETPDSDEPQTPAKLPSLRVLCIDDEPLLREMLKQILENGGHAVEVADGGREGLEMFRSARERGSPFEVVITDLGMPYVDGRQLAQMIKSESAQTPIIMLTGWGTMMKEDGDLPAQVDGVLSKPPKIVELYDMLRTVTKGTRKRKKDNARN